MKASLSKRECNRQRWYERFTAWKQSGLSKQRFCEQHQLGQASFQRWCKIFGRDESPEEPQSATFLPVTLRHAPSPLTIRVKDDLHIEIPTEFDPKVLGQVIQVLRAL